MVDPDSRHRRRRLRLLAGIVLAGAGLGAWHSRQSARGKPDPLTGAVRYAAVPIVDAVGSTGSWVSRHLGWLVRAPGLDAENRRLRSEIRGLREQVASLREASADLQRLRTQMGFAQAPPLPKLAGDVVSIRPDPHFDTLVVSRGLKDGIRRHSVVVAPSGVVGQVSDAGPTSSVVIMLTDPGSAIGAMVRRPDSRAVGICHGNGTGLLTLEFLGPEADVRAGDTVISSGLGGELGVYPKGLVIGRVTSVSPDNGGRVVTVKPAVDFGRLEEVYLLP